MGRSTTLMTSVPAKRRVSFPRATSRAVFAALVAAFVVCSSGPAARSFPASKTPQGPEVILDPRAGSDVVCIMVAVPVGSSSETAETRGAAHLVEHMVFDGSERYSREEISGWVDDVGGFLNAFTRKETTVYFLLVPSVHIERGIEILSQMLLHSVFLPRELEKERKVILEEIRRETDDPRSARERIVDRCLYRGSLLTEPVIGYPSTVETMSGADVKAFYRTHYVPAGMRIVVTGGFDIETTKGLLESYFAEGLGAPGDSCSDASGKAGKSLSLPHAAHDLEGAALHDLEGAASSRPQWKNEMAMRSAASADPGLDVLVPFPRVDDRRFPAAILVSRMLESDDSPLVSKCGRLSMPGPEISLEFYRGFSALRIHIGACEGGTESYRKVPAILERLADWRPTDEEVEKARVAFLSNEMFDAEMYHFYVMSRGEAIALFGDRYRVQCTNGVERVTAKDCARVLQEVFHPLRFNACVIEKEADSLAGQTDFSPPFIESLPNGCTVAALERRGSPVAALHLLIKGRACGEGTAPRGLAEILMTLFEVSSAGSELSKRLETFGARVRYGDNPYVSQDDYLLSPAYAYIRLEAPAPVAEEAASLLMKHLVDSKFTGQDLDAAKKDLAREVGMRSGSPYQVMRGAMMAGLLGVHPYAASIFPATPALMRVSLDELDSFRARFLVDGNLIATFVSPEPPANGCELLKKLLANVPPGPAVECPSLPDSTKAGSIEKTVKKEGAYLAAGWFEKSSNPSETASLLVAGEILSRRMQLELREKQGLAYSIECGVTPLPGGAVAIAQCGTGSRRLKEAEDAFQKEVRGLRDRLPDASEVAIAKSRLLGKRARSELSSINKAYVLGFDILLNGAEGYRSMNGLIGAVTADDAKKAIESSLSWNGALILRLVPEASGGR